MPGGGAPMSTISPGSSATPGERQWFIVSRWEAYAGEQRANLLRLIGIAGFYGVQLISYFFLQDRTPENRAFHILVTVLAIAWAMLALGIYWCLQARLFPDWLKFLSTGIDVVL